MTPPSGPPRWRHLRRVLVVGLVAALGTVLAAPAVVALLASWGREWVVSGDWAMLELGVADTGTAATRLVGPYSRLGWSHPGPLVFWSMAPLWRATGGASWSLLVGAAAINVGALVGVVALAWRQGRLALTALVTLALVWVVASLDDGLLADPWNPWVGVLAVAVVVLGVAGAVEGDGPALVAAVVAGSLCAQSHVGYVPVVGGLWLVGGVWAWRRGALGRRWWLWGAAVPLTVLWSPVLVDAVVGSGNIGALVGGVGGGDAAGWSGGLELVARQLGWDGPWRGGFEPISAVDGAVVGRPPGELVVPVGVFAVALAVGVWRGCGRAVRLQTLVGVGVIAGVIGTSRISGPAFDYLLRWWWPLAALWWSSAAWTLWEAAAAAWSTRRGTPGRAIAPWAPLVLAGVVVAVALPGALSTAQRTSTHPGPNAAFAGVVVTSVDATLAALGAPGPGDGGVVEVWSGGDGAGWVVDAVSVALERAGWEIWVPRTPVADGKWGRSRTREVDTFAWFAPSGVPVGNRRAVWVLGNGFTPVVGDNAGAPVVVASDPDGVDGDPIAVWVG